MIKNEMTSQKSYIKGYQDGLKERWGKLLSASEFFKAFWEICDAKETKCHENCPFYNAVEESEDSNLGCMEWCFYHAEQAEEIIDEWRG